jgi:small subunit ribosomal protein S20
MANHKSSIKRIRTNEVRRIRNKYQHKSTRNAVRRLREMTNKEEASTAYKTVASMLDRLAKNNVIHSRKAANVKSGLMVHINGL